MRLLRALSVCALMPLCLPSGSWASGTADEKPRPARSEEVSPAPLPAKPAPALRLSKKARAKLKAEYAAAAKECQTLIEQIPNQPWDNCRLMMERILVTYPADSPHLSRALLAMARRAVELNKHAEAVIYYQNWQVGGEDSEEAPAVMLELGREYRILGALSSAIDSFYAAMRALRQGGMGPKPVVRAAQWEIAATYYEAHEWDRAHKLFEMFTNAYKDEDLLIHTAYYRMGDSSRALGDTNQTITDYTRALAHDQGHPFAPEALVTLIEIYLGREHYDSAFENVRDLTELILKMPDDKALYW